ncbi:inactive serine/threonine-protein kinase TEX14-like [Varroa jacobsoni]|uniref:Protein kinase domain-containing protein n=1 Tax=Varroa destructor TaxID=109461 RepID=A0A7M7K2Z4_VARDE|nr:inactive serine/threonine-protein kinase TEX14-like [Varroa destructor]XP_022703508.1 inactive serine/threonine-protein kinase TEX14-like [Varroa jacobsoni]
MSTELFTFSLRSSTPVRMSACRLHEAAKANRVKELERLLDQGYHVDLVEGGFTALYLAVEAGHMSSVQFLLARKANPNARCIGGATAVHAACIRGSTTIVQQLILCGGDLRLRDDEGRTPCEWARDCQDPTARSRVIEFILRKRTDAYRLAERYVEDKLPTADGCALLKRRLSSGTQRRKWCTERLITDGGFGPLYQWGGEVGVPTHISYVSPGLLLHADDPRTTWAGPMTVLQTMYRDSLRVTVKRFTANRRMRKGIRSDVILQEIENIRRLTPHPNYLWPLAISPTENMEDAFIVYEAVHFGSLFKLLHDDDATPRLPTVDFIHMLRQICDAVLYLHETGFVHACINPHAIVVISPNLAKLSGFEFLQDERSQPNDCRKFTIGDRGVQEYYFHWLAPEVLANGSAKQASDLYSLAVVVWEVFTKTIPWCDEDLDSVYQELVVHKKILQTPDNIPSEFQRVMHMAMMPSISQRKTNLEEIYQQLSVIISGGQNRGPWPVTHNRRVANLYSSGQSSQLSKLKSHDISMRSSFRTPPPYVEDSELPSLYAGDTFETANMSAHVTMDLSRLPPRNHRKSATLMSTPKRPASVSSNDSESSGASFEMKQARKAEGSVKERLARLTNAFVSTTSSKLRGVTPPKKSSQPISVDPTAATIKDTEQIQTTAVQPALEVRNYEHQTQQVSPLETDDNHRQPRLISTHQKFAPHVASTANTDYAANKKSLFFPSIQKFSHTAVPCNSPMRVEKSLRFENETEESASDLDFSEPICKGDPEQDYISSSGEYEIVGAQEAFTTAHEPNDEAVYARVQKPMKQPTAPPLPAKINIDEVDGLEDRLRHVVVQPTRNKRENANSQVKQQLNLIPKSSLSTKSTASKAKPILLERNRTYKLEVVTDSEPAVRHHLRITETNRETGEVKISKETCFGASVSYEFVSGSTPSTPSGEDYRETETCRRIDQTSSFACDLTPGINKDMTAPFLDCEGGDLSAPATAAIQSEA